MTSFEIANALNTQGSAMMATGDYAASADAFSSALDLVKAAVLCQPPTRRGSTKTWKLATTHAFFDPCPSTFFEIFDHCFVAFCYCKEEGCVCEVDAEESHLMAAAMVFNFALANHLAGYQQIERQSRHWNRAQRLYQMAFEILKTKQELAEDSVTLYLAITNNLAALSLEFHDYTMLETCRTWMRQLVTNSVEIRTSFFVDNFVSVSNAHEWPAPAA